MYTLTQSMNYAQTFIQYVPLNAGFGQEPAVSTANMIRQTFLSAPMTWAWNRNTYTLGAQTVAGTQDYTILASAIPDFGFLEKVCLQDSNGKYWYITDILNSLPMDYAGAQDNRRPTAACILTQNSTNIVLRFMGPPNGIYTVSLIYQKRSVDFGPYVITSCGNASAGDTAYTGTFDTLAFAAGTTAQITGFANSANNGAFTVVSCTSTTLTVANASGVSQNATEAFASNFDWSPIPDAYSDVYNALFLSEMAQVADDPQRAQMYRQRGVAAFLAKAEGLTEMQKKSFMQQWYARGVEGIYHQMYAQMGNQARGV